MWNEYGLSNICVNFCKVKILDDEAREGVLASYVQGYGI